MFRRMFKSKIHRAVVTGADLNYEGSLTIDSALLEAADILPNEAVHVWDVTNGVRLTTYAIAGERNSGMMCVNGAGAHLIKPGDIIIVATFVDLTDEEARRHKPSVIFVDEKNRQTEKK
ncbi:MAG: aspartate 1-decarboxylase [Planctomycetia bacterium]|nr:aspartate 1-decarboxylase [Planctomycetia bacterium]